MFRILPTNLRTVSHDKEKKNEFCLFASRNPISLGHSTCARHYVTIDHYLRAALLDEWNASNIWSSSVYSKRSCRDRGLRCAVCMYYSICRRIFQQKNITQARLYRCWRKKNSCVRNRGFYTSKLPLPSRSKHTKDSIGSNSEFFSFSLSLWRKDDRWVSHSYHSVRIHTQHYFYRTNNEIGSNDFSPLSGSWGADLVSFQTYRKKTHYRAACTHTPFFGQSDRPTFLQTLKEGRCQILRMH